MAEDASKGKYAYLDQMSTEELQQILRGTALTDNGGDPAMLDHILEVIVAREKRAEHLKFPDVTQARKDFDRLYRDLEEPLYPTEDSSEEIPTPTSFKTKPAKRAFRYALVAAVIVAILVAITCIPVLGYANVVHMVAHWTAEQFSFQVANPASDSGVQSQQSSRKQLPEEYAELQTAMEQQGLPLSVPVFPEGFEAGEQFLYTDPTTGNVEFSIIYTRNDEYICYNVVQINDSSLTKYEKDVENVKQYECHGITHYIFSNNEEAVIATWVDKDSEYCLSTNSTSIEIEDLIQSVYKE